MELEKLEEENAELKEQLKFHICNQVGSEFQDFLTDNLIKIGILLNNYTSKKYQLNRGENRAGIEIKHDSKWQQYGRLYIEVEAINKSQTEMIGGGIKKVDRSWLYIIGDENKVWLFSKKQLNALYERVIANPDIWKEKYGISIRQHIDQDTGKATSSGMTIPLKAIEELNLSLREITFTRRD